jgi:Raf kinase inhibitor-like YbhB/YbcL family protein
MRKIFIILIFLTGCAMLLSACLSPDQEIPAPTNTPVPTETIPPTDPPTDPTPTLAPTFTPIPLSFSLSSPAFDAGTMIPKKYSREGEDISPPLEWGDPPDGTLSFALILYSDPLKDGKGNWVQWVLYNIPPETRFLPEAIPVADDGILLDGSQYYLNSWGELKYGGPNPQHTYTFNYYFVLYALDTKLDLDAVEKQMDEEGTLPWIGSSKAVLEEAVKGHVLGLGELVGKYKEELD